MLLEAEIRKGRIKPNDPRISRTKASPLRYNLYMFILFELVEAPSFDLGPEQSSTAKGIIRPSCVPTPTSLV
jgi:hypothetical protein